MNNKKNIEKPPFRKAGGMDTSPRFGKQKDLSEQIENTVIFGRNAVHEALLSSGEDGSVHIDKLFVQKEAKGLYDLIAKAKDTGVVVAYANEEKLASLSSNARHGGVVATLSVAPYVTLEDLLLVSSQKGTPPFLIIADEIEDPHNLGALIRTAEAAGADGLIIPKRRSAGLNGTVFHTSAGAASWLKVCRVPNLVAAIKTLKQNGIWVYGAEADGNSMYQTDFSGPIALVIGSEGNGLGRLVRETCDAVVSIDMFGRINSLNASVSGAILMYEVVRSRRKR